MSILYIQGLDKTPVFFPAYLSMCCNPVDKLGQETDKHWLIKTECQLMQDQYNYNQEIEVFNQFMGLCRMKEFSMVYITK